MKTHQLPTIASVPAPPLPTNLPQPRRIVLVRLPFFPPLTPPLGISLLKAHLSRFGHTVTCLDYAIDSELWSAHHRYSEILRQNEADSLNVQHSRLWFVHNAHMLAYVNGAHPATRARVVRTVAKLYGVDLDPDRIPDLERTVEAFVQRLGELLDRLDLSRVDYFGASTYSTSLAATLFALKSVKTRYPQVRTIMGGGVFFDDLAAGSANLDRLIERYPFVDHIVLGEGEILMQRVVEGQFDDRRAVTLDDIGRQTLDIDQVPMPDFSDFDVPSYMHLTIDGGRSCPFQCGFCAETVQWGKYRRKTPALLAEQMTELHRRHGTDRFFMGDSLVNPYITGLCSELSKAGTNLLIDGYLRAEQGVVDRSRVAEWARGGLYRARLGLETGSPRMLAIMNKQTTPSVMAEALRSLTEAGIRTTSYWVVGFPGETEKDFEETLAFVRENHAYIYEAEVHPFYYFPYGQVASRIFGSRALYDDDVFEAVGFQAWEVDPGEPSREEKFARARKFTQLASNLGIPNIFSMPQRIAAEQRWKRLSAAATEIY